MKLTARLLSIYCLLLLAAGCKKSQNTGPFTLGLDLQSWYQHDSVQVFLDNQQVFNDTATTNPVLGLASGQRLTDNGNDHTIKIVVNRQDSVVQTFHQTADLYLGINFLPSTHKITIAYASSSYTYL